MGFFIVYPTAIIRQPPAVALRLRHRSGLAAAVAPNAAHGQRRLRLHPGSLGVRTTQRALVPTGSPFAAGRHGIDLCPSKQLAQQVFRGSLQVWAGLTHGRELYCRKNAEKCGRAWRGVPGLQEANTH